MKPHEFFDVSAPSIRLLVSTLDSFLGTTEIQGLALHRAINTLLIWVRSLADVDSVSCFRSVPTSADFAMPVKAYLPTGSDLR